MSFPGADLLRLGAFLLVALLIGLASHHVAMAIAVALALYCAWQHRQLLRLLQWVRHRKERDAPDVAGLFEELCSEIDRLRERHKRRKKKLSGYLKQFQQATNALPDAVIVLGEDAEIGWANAAAARYLNVHWPQDAGQRLTNLVRFPVLKDLVESEPLPDRSIEIPAPADDGTQLSVQVVPYGADQRLLVARDVTRLHRLSQTRTDFVANVSHELRTPLTVFSGYLETIEGDREHCPPPWVPVIEQMRSHVARMQSVIEELLLLSRLEQADRVQDPEPVPVPELLASIQKEAQALSAEKRHLFNIAVDTTLWLRGSASELHSALSNLVFNAVQYTPARGFIKIRWWRDADGAHFAVQDTGIGIPAHHLPRLTERFYRVDPSRSRESGGTGLGLAIVKHVLARHGATLQVDSVVEEGSTFTCHFPPEAIVEADAVRALHQSA
jgi:two-component system phosphate regulon sensor histidine kinase PhoR